MEPSRTFQEEGERVLRDHMTRFQESLSPEEKERIREETLAMKTVSGGARPSRGGGFPPETLDRRHLP